jgi:RNA polymerase sigma factor (sigma-70 family)
MSITQDTPAKNGARLNYLYEQYQQQPNSESQDALFAEIQDYAKRLVTNFAKLELVPVESVIDGVQQACLKIFQRFDSFKCKSKFSTWVFSFVKNSFYDELRRKFRLKEVSLSEEKPYGEYVGKSKRCPNSAQQEGYAGEGDPDEVKISDATLLISLKELSREENKLNTQFDGRRLDTSLSDEDSEILQSYQADEDAATTAERLGIKTKHVYNRRQVLKNRILQARKSVPIARTLSAKDAEALAQGDRRAQQFAKASLELEQQRWDRLTTTRPWYSSNQVFPSTRLSNACCTDPVEDFTVFRAIHKEQRSSVGRTLAGPAPFVEERQGIPYKVDFKAYTDTHTWNWANVCFVSIGCSRVSKTDTSCACSHCLAIRLSKYLDAKSLDTHLVNTNKVNHSENLPEWVSKIPNLERLSSEEGLISLPT